ncbi:MAG: phosphate ABC transporter substrate-binding protein [Spirochaetales bacterium]|nr:phosphate ABC transporter substrate-binding protein [Spirochaetales bacterium]
MKKIAFIALALMVAATVFANGKSDASAEPAKAEWSGSFAFGGSTTLEPIIVDAIEVMQARYPGVQISYDAPGSSAGVSGAIDGTYSLGCASRELKDDEKAKGAVATPVALDGVAVVVNKASVGVDNLSLEQVSNIFAGEITNWSEVGGKDAPIVVISRDEASGTRDCFDHATFKAIGKKIVQTALITTGNGDMVAKVGATPNSIGYCGFGYITKDPGAKAVTVNEVAPSEKNVLAGSYAISRKLNVISKGQFADGSFEKFFLDYLLSSEGQEIAASNKFIKL